MGLFARLSYWGSPFPGQTSPMGVHLHCCWSTESQRARKAGLWSASKKQNALHTPSHPTGNRQREWFCGSLHWRRLQPHSTLFCACPPIYQLLVEYLCSFLYCHYFACLTTHLMKQLSCLLCISLHYSFIHLLYFVHTTHTLSLPPVMHMSTYFYTFLLLFWSLSILRLTPHSSILSPEKATPTNQSSNKHRA